MRPNCTVVLYGMIKYLHYMIVQCIFTGGRVILDGKRILKSQSRLL